MVIFRETFCGDVKILCGLVKGGVATMDNTKITAFQVASLNRNWLQFNDDDEDDCWCCLELASTTSNMSFLKKSLKVSKCHSHFSPLKKTQKSRNVYHLSLLEKCWILLSDLQFFIHTVKLKVGCWCYWAVSTSVLRYTT